VAVNDDIRRTMLMFSEPKVNVIESDQGYSVEVLGRVGLKYTEGEKSLTVDSEVLMGPSGMVVYKSSIRQWDPPHSNQAIDKATRERIIDNIRAAFHFKGYEIEVD
jgi:hypothetical protein